MRVLVADDSNFMRMLLKKMLEEGGHQVISEAINGQDAFEKFMETNPDLVLMDITMPEVNGLDGLRMIKMFSPNAKVVICSAMSQISYIKNALEIGAKDFVVKPIIKERLLATIKNI